MIRAKGRDRSGRPVFYLGIDDENVRRLKEGDPIAFNGEELGITGTVIICYGTMQQLGGELGLVLADSQLPKDATERLILDPATRTLKKVKVS